MVHGFAHRDVKHFVNIFPSIAYFEHLWRQVDKREKRETNSDPAQRKVRLDCTGELIDLSSIDLVVVRSSEAGVELIEFLCPRCERLHESLPFP